MRVSAGHAVLLAATLGTAAGIWLIHDIQRVEREVSSQARLHTTHRISRDLVNVLKIMYLKILDLRKLF